MTLTSKKFVKLKLNVKHSGLSEVSSSHVKKYDDDPKELIDCTAQLVASNETVTKYLLELKEFSYQTEMNVIRIDKELVRMLPKDYYYLNSKENQVDFEGRI